MANIEAWATMWNIHPETLSRQLYFILSTNVSTFIMVIDETSEMNAHKMDVRPRTQKLLHTLPLVL